MWLNVIESHLFNMRNFRLKENTKKHLSFDREDGTYKRKIEIWNVGFQENSILNMIECCS